MIGRCADFLFNKLYGLEQRIFDLRLGVATAGRSLTSSDVYSAGSSNWPYEGCHWPALSLALRDLKPAERDVFVDLGSGRGKALLIAGRLPYQRVVGVEIDSELAESSRRNLARSHRRLQAGLVEQEIANVLDWPIPDNATMIFMYNPFFGETFRAAMAKVFDSYDRNPRDLHIVYEFPWEHDWLVATGRVVVENVRPSAWPPRPRWWERGDVIVTYHVTGTGRPSAPVPCPHRRRGAASRAMRRWRGPNGHPFKDDGPRGATGHRGTTQVSA
jgi:predicted RNA methylase